MTDEMNNDLNLLIEISKGNNSSIAKAKLLNKDKMHSAIKKTIIKSGLHKKLSVDYLNVIEDIEQEAWMKLLRKLKKTPDIKKDVWLSNTKLSVILMKLSTDKALDYAASRGLARNLKVDKNIPKGLPRNFESVDNDTGEEPLITLACSAKSPEELINEDSVQSNFIEELGTIHEKEITSHLLDGMKRNEIMKSLNISLSQYNKALTSIKKKLDE
jgi:DNA-directed RNA polymerase specialized sigma24 family protein